MTAESLETLLREIRACARCALPHGPRPVLRASETAKILIAGQAPGTKVHASGIPWHDASGERLREWMALDRDVFYDESRIAIVPMGFCYPGKGASGDLPPRRECRDTWHDHLIPLMPNVELVIAIGQYAQAYFIGDGRALTDTVRDFRAHLPRVVPLPHPSPRNVAWFKRNPWFEADVLPTLRERVRDVLGVPA